MTTVRRSIAAWLTLALTISVMAGVPPFQVQGASAAAYTFDVVNPADVGDSNPGNGTCEAAGGCTLRAALAETAALGLTSADTVLITLADQQVLNGAPSNTYAITSELTVPAGPAITIRDVDLGGNQSPEIDGDKTFKLMSLASGGNLHLHQVTLRDAVAPWGSCLDASVGTSTAVQLTSVIFQDCDSTGTLGGALAIGGTLTSQFSVFNANDNTGGSGGALSLFSGSDTTLDTDTFVNNTAVTDGGAISGGSAVLDVTGANFDSNDAVNGGAIVFSGAAGSNLAVTDSTFQLNNATGDGGAIVLVDVPFTSTRTDYVNNVADGDGGAIRSYNSGPANAITIEGDCHVTLATGCGLFTDNDANFDGNGVGGSGGGVHHPDTAPWTIDGIYAELNSATNTGLSGAGGFAHLAGEGTISNSTLVDNDADDGGAVALATGAVPGPVTVADSTFRQNDAVLFGGGLFVGDDVDASVVRTSFVQNAGGLGGAIAVETDASLRTVSTTLHENAADNGGAIYANNGTTVDLAFTTINDNVATEGGGAFITDASTVLTMQASILSTNTATVDPQVCAMGLTPIESNGWNHFPAGADHGCTFNAEPSDTSSVDADLGDAGVVQAPMLSSPVLDLIPNATCAAVVSDVSTTLGLDASTDQLGTARPFGTSACESGAFEAPTDGTVIEFLVDSTETGPLAGSPLYCSDGTTGCTLQAAVDAANQLAGHDVTIELDSNETYTWDDPTDELVLSGSANSVKIWSNPSGAGAVIDAANMAPILTTDSSQDVDLDNLFLANGSSTAPGGCISNSGALRVTNSIIMGCSATGATSDGGAIWNAGDLTVLWGGTSGSVSGRNGGAIWNGGTAYVHNHQISNNTADLNGGGIHSETGSLEMSYPLLNGNCADVAGCANPDPGPNNFGQGGGLYTHSGTLEIYSNTVVGDVDGNEAHVGGGGIAIGPGTTAGWTVDNVEVTFNDTALQTGGGILVESPGVISNSRFEDNVADGGGGAVGIVNGAAHAGAATDILDSQFFFNTADSVGGGAVLVEGDSTLHLVRSALIENTARGTDNGGGLRVQDPDSHATVVSSTLAYNDAGGIKLWDGTLDVWFSTIVDNTRHAIDIEGGTVSIGASIISGGYTSECRDTTGTPGVVTDHGFNVIGSTFDCDRAESGTYAGSAGSTVVSDDPQLTFDFYDAPFAAVPDPTSPAVDRVDETACAEIDADVLVATDEPADDQTGRDRVAAAGLHCDAGSIEIDGDAVPPALDVTLSRSNAASTKPGASAVPAGSITVGKKPSGAVQSTGIIAADAAETPLAQIPLSQIPLAQIPLAQIPLSQIDFDNPAVAAGLSQVPLSELSINKVKTNGEAYSWRDDVLPGSSYADAPLHTVSLAQALADPVAGPRAELLDFKELGLGATPLAQIPLLAAVLFDFDVTSFPWETAFPAYDPDPALDGQHVETLCAWLAAEGTATCADLDIPSSTSDERGIMDIGIAGAPLAQIPLAQIPLAQIPLSQIPLAQIPLSQIPLAQIPLSQIPLAQIDLVGTPLAQIPVDTSLGQIPLAQIPLSQIPLAQIPLSQIPLGQVPLSQIPLAQIDLGQIPLAQIDLVGTPLAQIPLSQIPLAQIPLGEIPLSQIPLSQIPLAQIPLSQIPLSQIPLGQIPLAQIPLSQIPLAQIPLAQIATLSSVIDCQAAEGEITGFSCDDPGATTLVDVANHILSTAGLADAAGTHGWNGTTLVQLHGTNGTAPEFTDTELRDLGEYGTTTLGEMQGAVGTTAGWGDTQLASVLRASDLALHELDGLMADIGHPDEFEAMMEQVTIGELEGFGPMTLVDLLHLLGDTFFDVFVDALARSLIGDAAEDVTLLDLMLALLEPEQFPWQEIDVASGGIQLATGGTTYTIDLDVDGQVEFSPLTVTMTLPETAVIGTADIAPTSIVDNVVTWVLPTVPDGLTSIDVQVGESLLVGDTTTIVETTSTELPDVSDTLDYAVAEEFEPNDDPGDTGIADLQDGTIYLSHIGQPGDRDLYRATLEAGDGLTVHLGGIPAGQDYDLVVYGPAGTDVNGFPVQSVEGGQTAQQQGNDIPLLTDRPVLKISSRRGSASERVDLNAVRASGEYLIQATGYNESNSPKPYTIRSQRFAAPDLGECTPRAFPHGGVPSQAPIGLDAETNTLFLLARSRFAQLHGAAALADVEAALAPVMAMNGALGGAPVNGALVDLGHDADVNGAFVAFDAADSRCDVTSANAVVEEVRDLIAQLRADHPGIESIVLVGADEVLPFERVADLSEIANERTYLSTMAGENSELVAALAHGYLLTDNSYGDSSPDVANGRPIWVPEIAVGRLVETPAEIISQLDHFAQFDGRLDGTTTRTAAVAGYEFLTDGSHRIADELDADQQPGTTTDRSLIDDTWTADDLRALVQGNDWDVLSPNAHFDHYRALSAAESVAGTHADLFETTDVAGDYAGSIWFTMGCHSGYSVSDISIGASLDVDWPQTISGQPANYVGNTGFGYGETETVALSELLMSQFADRLDGSMTIGDAMAFAKAEYAADLSAYGVYDEKVMMEATLYGLPMYLIGGQAEAPPAAAARTLSTDPATGLRTATDVDFDVDATPFVQQVGTNGAWWEVKQGPAPTDDSFTPQVTANQPIQPRWELDVTAHDGVGGVTAEPRGVFVEGLSAFSTGVSVDPAVATPVVDSAASQPEPRLTDLAFPTSFARVSNYATPHGPAGQMVFVPGQFVGDWEGGRQLLFEQADLTVYYADLDDPDVFPPTIHTSKAIDEDTQVLFRVRASDQGGSVARVRVVYRDPGTNDWRGLDLPKVAGPDADGISTFEKASTLSNPLGAGEDLEFFSQALDTSANAGISSGKAVFHTSTVGVVPDEPDPETPAQPVITSSEVPTNGWYEDPVTVAIEGDDGQPAQMFVDDAPVSSPATVTGDGLHQVDVVDAGVTNTIHVGIDDSPPIVDFITPRPGQVVLQRTLVETEVRVTEKVGLASSTVPAVVDTKQLGDHTITGTFTDWFDHAATASSTYRVVDLKVASQIAMGTELDVRLKGMVDGEVVQIDWGDGTTSEWVIDHTTDHHRHPYDTVGTYLVRITVPSSDPDQYAPTTFDRVVQVVDQDAPVIDIMTPEDGQVFLQDEQVHVDVSIADPSGIATSSIDPLDPPLLDTSTPGTHQLTVTATDPYGNTATEHATYQVIDVDPADHPVTTYRPFGIAVDGLEGGQDVTIHWGDGSTTRPTPSGGSDSFGHRYADAGVFEATVVVGGRSVHVPHIAVYVDVVDWAGGRGTVDSPTGPVEFGLAARAGTLIIPDVVHVSLDIPEDVGVTAGGRFLATARTGVDVARNGGTMTMVGDGVLDGVPGHRFEITATDGRTDRIRIRVFAPDDGPEIFTTGTSTTRLVRGSIVVRRLLGLF